MEFLLGFDYFLVILGPYIQHVFPCGCRAELRQLDSFSADLIDNVNGNEIKSLICLIIPETE